METKETQKQSSKSLFSRALYAWRKAPISFRRRTQLTTLFLLLMIGMGAVTGFLYNIAEDNDINIIELMQVYQGKISAITGGDVTEEAE